MICCIISDMMKPKIKDSEKVSRMTDIAIIQNLSKCYQIYSAPRDRLKLFFAPRLQRMAGQPKQYFREFWALKDISFEIKGRNRRHHRAQRFGQTALAQTYHGQVIELYIISDKHAVRAEVSKPNYQAVGTLRYLRVNGLMNYVKINSLPLNRENAA